jgi:glutamyl-tRNA synthetase
MPAPVTRFAPSPTGILHIGGARTALFNWAYARQHRGRFLVRIEDTDSERSSRESETALLASLRWLGLDWDEEPVRQSERRPLHDAAVERLLASGRAYRCICGREDLEARKEATIAAGAKWTYDGRCRDAGHGPDCGPHTVRLRVDPEERLEWEDLVFGPSGQLGREIGDKIVRRSDGSPLYHLAVVVDDAEMGVDVVIRGADHHPNTPFQLALYRALDAPVPRFAHVPLIVNDAGKKLSKRRDTVAVEHFRDAGYLPEAMRNWLVRLGWSHGDQELFSADEIVALFDLASVGRAGARADLAKLLWLNQHYVKSLPMDALFTHLAPHLEKAAGGPVRRSPELERLIDLLRERSKTLEEMARLARFLVVDVIGYDEAAARKHLRPEVAPVLAELHDRLAALDEWNEKALETAFDAARAAHGDLAMGQLAQPVRVAVTGGVVSPGIFETLAVLGPRATLRRLAEAVHYARHGS